MKPGSGYLLFVFFAGLLQFTGYAQNIDPAVKRIVFLGNSITWQGSYVNDVELYLRINYPGRQFEIINMGLPSETVSGLSEPGHAGGAFPRPDLHERLSRVLAQSKPDLVFACYGMNDGIYMPFDAVRFQRFKEGINWLHAEVVKTGARLIHLTPPCYDEWKGKTAGYKVVLDRYTDWLLRLSTAQKWEVIDIHYPMQQYLEAHRRIDSQFRLDGFALAADGIHPDELGHWIIARQILQYLHCRGVDRVTGIAAVIAQARNGNRLYRLVKQRQSMMRDAWLTATRYQRPGLPAGLPLAEAQAIAAAEEEEITALSQNRKIAEVYLIGGQSNATGQGYTKNRSDTMIFNENILLYHSGKPHLETGLPAFTWHHMHQASESPDRFGPELGFAGSILPVNPDAQIAVIKHAHSGTSLFEDWKPGSDEEDTAHFGSQFRTFLQTVDGGLDSLRKRGYFPIVKGMLWQQGEADAYSADSISIKYGGLLSHFIARVRAHVHQPQMVFVYGYVCPPPLNGTGIKTVREAEHDIDEHSGTSLAVKNAFVVETDDLSHRSKDRNTAYPQDELHFGTEGTWVLGVRMARLINAVFDQHKD